MRNKEQRHREEEGITTTNGNRENENGNKKKGFLESTQFVQPDGGEWRLIERSANKQKDSGQQRGRRLKSVTDSISFGKDRGRHQGNLWQNSGVCG